MNATRNTIFFYLLASGISLAQPPADSGWVAQTLPVPASLLSVAALDANTAVAVGSAGIILRTADGGATWNLQPSRTTASLNAVSFIDAKTGFAVGASGTILRTTDGGVTWTQQSSGSSGQLCGVAALNATTAIAVGISGTASACNGSWQTHISGLILRTSDGGATWAQQSTAAPLWAVAFADENTGIVVGYRNLVLRTTDGGVTWKDLNVPEARLGGLRAVFLADPNTGTTAGGDGIFRTTDGGVSWTRGGSCGTTTSGRCNGVSLTGASTGTIVGDFGRIFRTGDGGVTWNESASGTSKSLYGVAFTDALTGWVVGGGTILYTATGGEPGPIAVSSASLTGPLAPDSLGTIRGSGFAATTETGDLNSPPTILGGVSVRVHDSAGVESLAPLLYVSPKQIDFEVPHGAALGEATLELVNAPATVPPVVVTVRNVAPGLFTLRNGIAAAYGVRVEADGTQTVLPPGSPIVLDDRIVDLVVAGTGIRNRSSLASVKCTIGGMAVPVEYAGPGGGAPGLDQLNVRLTSALIGNTDRRLVLTVDGVLANVVLVDVR